MSAKAHLKAKQETLDYSCSRNHSSNNIHTAAEQGERVGTTNPEMKKRERKRKRKEGRIKEDRFCLWMSSGKEAGMGGFLNLQTASSAGCIDSWMLIPWQ
jgi:hypothetical protein